MEKQILLLTDSFGGGGAERTLTYLTGGLQGTGFKISARSYLKMENQHAFPPGAVLSPLLLNAKKRFHQGPLAAASFRLIALCSHLHRFPFSFDKTRAKYEKTLQHLNNYYYACKALNEIIKKERPNLILTFRRHSALIALMTRFIYRLKVPIYCSHRSHLSRRIGKLPHPGLFKFAANFFYKRADFHTAVSQGVRHDIITNFGVPESNIATVYSAVDIEFVRTWSREAIEDDLHSRILSDPSVPKIMNIGSLKETKGQEYLLKAFEQVIRKVDCRLLIAGKGQNREYLESLSRQMKIDQSVFFLGWQKNPFKFMGRCDVFVSSSLSDGFSNVLLEAMACHLPVIATDCQFGPREILADGKYGILVPIKDENALAAAILRVLTDEDFRMELRHLSEERVQQFGIEIMLGKYQELFARATDSQ